MPGLKSGDPEFKSYSHSLLDLFQVVLDPTPRLSLYIVLFFGTNIQYSRERRQDEEGKQSNKAAIRDLVLTFCRTMHSIQQRKLKLLMPVL